MTCVASGNGSAGAERVMAVNRSPRWTSAVTTERPRKPVAPVNSKGSVLADGPVIGDVIVERVESLAARRIVRVRATIGDEGERIRHAFESVPHAGRNNRETVLIGTEEELLELTFGRRSF